MVTLPRKLDAQTLCPTSFLRSCVHQWAFSLTRLADEHFSVSLMQLTLLVMVSSFVVTCSMIITMLQKGSPPPYPVQTQNEWVLLPLILLGIGYSIYACALWGSIPYTVPENMLGSAFGLCTAVQNTGLTITPFILTLLQSLSKPSPKSNDNTVPYNNLSLSFLAFLGFIGFCINIWLYLDDINNRGGQLNNVYEKKEQLEAHMTSPTPVKKEILVGSDQENMFVGETKFTEDAKDPNAVPMEKDALKRSMARSLAH
jgi:MFS family permease